VLCPHRVSASGLPGGVLLALFSSSVDRKPRIFVVSPPLSNDVTVVSRKLAYFTSAPDASVPLSAHDVTYTEAFVSSLSSPGGATAGNSGADREGVAKAGASGDGAAGTASSSPVCRVPPRGLPTDGILAGVSDLLREVMIPAVGADNTWARAPRGGLFNHERTNDDGAFDTLSKSAVRYSTLLFEMARSMSAVVDIDMPFDGLGTCRFGQFCG
jgi:hypothetical protein